MGYEKNKQTHSCKQSFLDPPALVKRDETCPMNLVHIADLQNCV